MTPTAKTVRPALIVAALLGLTGCGISRVATPPPLAYARYSSESHNDFGVTYENEGDLARADRQFRKAVEKDPANHVAWTNLGNVQAAFETWGEAREAYARALALAPGYGPAANNLAMTYLAEDEPRPELAVTILEAHLPLVDPIYEDAVRTTLAEARAAVAAP